MQVQPSIFERTIEQPNPATYQAPQVPAEFNKIANIQAGRQEAAGKLQNVDIDIYAAQPAEDRYGIGEALANGSHEDVAFALGSLLFDVGNKVTAANGDGSLLIEDANRIFGVNEEAIAQRARQAEAEHAARAQVDLDRELKDLLEKNEEKKLASV